MNSPEFTNPQSVVKSEGNTHTSGNVRTGIRELEKAIKSCIFGPPNVLRVERRRYSKRQNSIDIWLNGPLNLTTTEIYYIQYLVDCNTVTDIHIFEPQDASGKPRLRCELCIRGNAKLDGRNKIQVRTTGPVIIDEGASVSGCRFEQPSSIKICNSSVAEGCSFFRNNVDTGDLIIHSSPVKNSFIGRFTKLAGSAQVITPTLADGAVLIIPRGELACNITVDIPVGRWSSKGHPPEEYNRYLFDAQDNPRLAAILKQQDLVLYSQQTFRSQVGVLVGIVRR